MRTIQSSTTKICGSGGYDGSETSGTGAGCSVVNFYCKVKFYYPEILRVVGGVDTKKIKLLKLG